MNRWTISRVFAVALLVIPLYAGNENNFTYLALGDSIPFGYNPTVIPPAVDKYIGYPEVIATATHLLQSKKLVNASCPGETSGSFLVLGAPDLGCLDPGPQGQPGFKYSVGLHTMYQGTQSDFALTQLSTNSHINLVTLGIGGNDLLLLAQRCALEPNFSACVIPGLDPVLNAYARNLTEILSVIRIQAHYQGTLVLVNNYVPNADPLFTLAISLLNDVMVQVGTQFDVKIADAFSAFHLSSALYGGDPCAAGLVVRISQTACDVHPSVIGRNLLASAVLLVATDKSSEGNSAKVKK